MSGQTQNDPLPPPIPLPGNDADGAFSGTPSGAQPNQSEFVMVETDGEGQPVGAQPKVAQTPPAQTEEAAEPTDRTLATEESQSRFRERDNRSRRQRQHQARDETYRRVDFLETELRRLNEQLERYEPRFAEIDESRLHSQVAEIDRRLDDARRLKVEASRNMASAMANNDSDSFQAALEARDAATEAELNLKTQRERMAAPETRFQPPGPIPQGQQQRAPAAPTVPLNQSGRELLADFQAEHEWIQTRPGPNGLAVPADLDSEMMLRIDNYVVNQGYNPNTQEYWDEVRTLGAQYLPHRFERQAGQSNRDEAPRRAPERRGPPVAGSPAPAAPRQAGNNQVYISPDRKEALIAAGVMSRDGSVNDRTKLQRMLKGYAEWDRQHGTQARQ